MRGIKFRLVHNGRIVGYEEHQYSKENNHVTIFHNDYNIEAVEAAEIQHDHKDQFTGVTDKDGVEIFEGDIFKCAEPDGWSLNGVVCWQDSGFVMMWTKEYARGGDKRRRYAGLRGIRRYTHYKVIGNIHENPELLKEQCK